MLNQAVKRNLNRFPKDFMLQLSEEEYEALRSQIVILEDNQGRGRHRKYMPYAFSEQGVAILSSVLRSDRAVEVNIQIMRAFVKLRELLGTHKDLARKIDEHDHKITAIIATLNKMLEPPATKKHPIGFRVTKD